jgi:hypothetical protein
MTRQDKTLRQTSQAGLSTRLKTPTDHRPCFAIILIHASNENRSVPNATFFCVKNTTDAHNELDGKCYEMYFAEKLLPNLPHNLLIVADKTSYHNRSC